jgi:hypothetical protein
LFARWRRPASEAGFEFMASFCVYSSLQRGWFFGSEHFREELLKMLAERPVRIEKANGYYGPQLNDYAERRAKALIRAALEQFGTDLPTLRQARKGDWRKRLLAAIILKERTMKLDWITEQLNMGRARAFAVWRARPEDVSLRIAACEERSKQ